ncbi:MAG: HRDC domain-containing protein [Anaerolineales bacterium]|nr:HRDC domain-containing protein [Anaerolineales bacterium]
MNAVLPAPIWVDTPDALWQMRAHLLVQPRVAVDTEANSLYAFREQVCLIQFSIPEADYLLDPLTLHDLTPLADIFSNETIEKVFHAAEYDLLGLQRDYGFTFANIFDTMLAARILGYKQLGLGHLLAEKFQVELDKRYQKADWGARPLPPGLIDYARLDTHYLLDLRDCLEAELRARERLELAREDFQRSCYVTNGSRHLKERWERIEGQQDLTPREQTILNELCLCREKLAERLNRPLFKVLDDRRLLNLAQTAPQSLEALRAAGLSERQIDRFGRALLEAIERGQSAPVVRPTEIEKPAPAILGRLNKLKAWRKKKADELGVESDIILPRVYLMPLAEHNPRTAEALAAVMSDSPWRVKHFGAEILKTLGAKSSG